MNNLKLTLIKELQHREICDSSAAIALGKDRFVVANDEDNILRIYQADRSGGPIELDINHYFNNNPDQAEVDLEGAAELDDLIYWISSHGRNKKGKSKPERHQFFANRCTQSDPMTFEQVGHSYNHLVRDMINDDRLQRYQLEAAEKLPPKQQGGLNIEGLAATLNKELLIGFRNPIVDGKALLLPLKNPRELIETSEATAQFGEPIELDLDGLGIRSIEYWEAKQRYIIVAGPYDGGDQFALYQWNGNGDPQQIAGDELPTDFRPEGILFYADRDDELQLLSDDGTIVRDGKPCKEVEDRHHPQKYFRSLWCKVQDA